MGKHATPDQSRTRRANDNSPWREAMGKRRTDRLAPEQGVTLCHTMFATSRAEPALRPVPGLGSSNAQFPTAYAVGYFLSPSGLATRRASSRAGNGLP